MERQRPKKAVMNYVNHGDVFGGGDWYTFYCGNCGRQVYGDAGKCKYCDAILQRKETT